MEHTLSSHPGSKIEENEINLVLEQLQENGFSSFFDHPDCPFASIKEVDEALKELEKEFLKLCGDKSSKSKCRSRSVIDPNKSPVVQLKNQPINSCMNSDCKLGESKNTDRENAFSKLDSNFCSSNSPNIIPSINFADGLKGVDLGSGDTKEVCAVDSCGNKYSLKIEVFATVKLENEEKSDNSKIQSSRSVSQIKGRKNKNPTGFNVLSPLKLSAGNESSDCPPLAVEEDEPYTPLLLSYKSSMSKPCPSFMYPTASDLRRNVVSRKVKPETAVKSVKVGPQPLKDASAMSLTREPVSGNQNKKLRDVSLRKEEGCVLHGQNIFVNYSAADESNKFDVVKSKVTSLKKDSFESQSIQAIATEFKFDSNVDKDSSNCDSTTVDIKPMVSQELQTSFEELMLAYSSKNQKASNSSPVHNLMLPTSEQGVNTSVRSFESDGGDALGGIEESRFELIGSVVDRKFDEMDCTKYSSDYIGVSSSGSVEQISNRDCNIIKIKPMRSISDVLISEGLSSEGLATDEDGEALAIPVTYDSIEPSAGTSDESTQSEEVIKSCDLFEFEESESRSDRVTLESSSKETVILRSSCSVLKSLGNLSTVNEESTTSTHNCTTMDESTSAITVASLVDKGVGDSDNCLTSTDPTPKLVDREIDCKSEETFDNQCIESKSLMSKDAYTGDDTTLDIKKDLVDREVGMSFERMTDFIKQIRVDKEVKTSSVFIKNQSTTMNKDPGSRSMIDFNTKAEMVDRDTDTQQTSKSMCVLTEGASKKNFEKCLKVGFSDRSVGSGSRCTLSDSSWLRESSSDQESNGKLGEKKNLKSGKISKSRASFGYKFRRGEARLTASDKLIRATKERRDRKKSDDKEKNKESFTRRSRSKQDQDKSSLSGQCCSNDDKLRAVPSKDRLPRSLSSRDGHTSPRNAATEAAPRPATGHRNPREIMEFESKFVKGVFSRHNSSGKNRLSIKRRAFSNLDQKMLVKSKKSMGMMRSKKSWDRMKSHRAEMGSMKKSYKEASTTSSTDFSLPDCTVINSEE